MKKFGVITIAIAIVAVGIFIYNRSQSENRREMFDEQKGTLVKEQVEWTRFYT